jgi:hypothetical protein
LCLRTRRILPYDDVQSLIRASSLLGSGILDNRFKTSVMDRVSSPTDMAACSEGFVIRYSWISDGLLVSPLCFVFRLCHYIPGDRLSDGDKKVLGGLSPWCKCLEDTDQMSV